MSYQPNYGRAVFLVVWGLWVGMVLKFTIWPSLSGGGLLVGLLMYLFYLEWSDQKETHGR